MARKLGEGRAAEMFDRGFCELGALWNEGNIPQPMYPRRVGYSVAKDAADQMREEDKSSILEAKLQEIGASRDDPGRDEREIDGPEMDR